METELGLLTLEKRRLQGAFCTQSGTDILAQPDTPGRGVMVLNNRGLI